MPTQENICKFNEAQNSLIKSYEKEQNEYIQLKIDEIENAVTNKKSAIAWKLINESILLAIADARNRTEQD